MRARPARRCGGSWRGWNGRYAGARSPTTLPSNTNARPRGARSRRGGGHRARTSVSRSGAASKHRLKRCLTYPGNQVHEAAPDARPVLRVPPQLQRALAAVQVELGSGRTGAAPPGRVSPQADSKKPWKCSQLCACYFPAPGLDAGEGRLAKSVAGDGKAERRGGGRCLPREDQPLHRPPVGIVPGGPSGAAPRLPPGVCYSAQYLAAYAPLRRRRGETYGQFFSPVQAPSPMIQ